MTERRRIKVKVDLYKVVCRAVEEGVTFGLNRAHKHTDRPTREQLQEHVENEVISALCEVLHFDD